MKQKIQHIYIRKPFLRNYFQVPLDLNISTIFGSDLWLILYTVHFAAFEVDRRSNCTMGTLIEMKNTHFYFDFNLLCIYFQLPFELTINFDMMQFKYFLFVNFCALERNYFVAFVKCLECIMTFAPWH